MKRILQTVAFATLIMLGSSWRNTTIAQSENYGDENNDISYQEFYDQLSPYGRWIEYPEYGYVWSPNGISGFRPYETGGHWAWSDEYEWMWVSDYDWGWAPFHYGRWFYDPFYGWMWMPGYEWAPAWVAWRDGGDYYGWAPLRPGFSLGINISLGGYNPPADYWCFAPRRYISSPRIYDYCIDRSRNVTIINNTTIINNYSRRNSVFVNGPRRMDAERYAGRINPVRFRESSGPGRSFSRNNEVSIYRPRVRQNNNRQFTPRSYDRYERNGNNSGTVRNNNNGNRNNGNNLPGARDRNSRLDRNNNQPGQRPNNNGDTRSTERRNVFERRNDQQPGNSNGSNENRRNTINRGNSNNQANPNAGQQGSAERSLRRPFEQRNNEVRQPQQNNEVRQPQNSQRTERRNIFERSRNSSQENRPETRNNNRVERQPSAAPRQQNDQPRQFGNRNNAGRNEQRGSANNNGNGSGQRRSSGRH